MEITNEAIFKKRREFIKLGAAGLVSTALVKAKAAELSFTQVLEEEPSNPNNLSITPFDKATSYVNFYEFSTDKTDAAELADEKLNTKGWKVEVSGLCENPQTLSMEDILKFPLEKRVYRFRCVEAWAMVVPWVGFELSHLIKQAKPTSEAKYVKFTTLYNPKQFPDQASLFPTIEYPYVEGLRMDEAMHPLTIMAVGMYDKPLPKSNGAPIRLVVPWKYGFKSIKSVVKIEFVKDQPQTTWNKFASNEYGFYANVNPDVQHPRWSQSSERVLGKFFKQKTLKFNGYDEVASLYTGMDLKKYF